MYIVNFILGLVFSASLVVNGRSYDVIMLWDLCLSGISDPPQKVQKNQYAKANITNTADKLIRKELDDGDSTLEKVVWIPL